MTAFQASRPSARERAKAWIDTAAPAASAIGLFILTLPASAAAQTAIDTDAAAAMPLPHDLSPLAMFLAADWVVKGVMICLAAASLATWTIWLAKSLQLLLTRRRTRRSLHVILHARSLDEAVTRSGPGRDPAALMLLAAREETDMSAPALRGRSGQGLKERVASVLSRIEVHGAARLMRGTGLLATIGSVAPFVGLFGTVWGIMNAFIGISKAQTTNLAVVAPGIAEALLATAIGLVAAIPAVVIYNIFARAIGAYRHILADASAGVERLVSRDLDFRAAEAAPTPSLSRAAE